MLFQDLKFICSRLKRTACVLYILTIREFCLVSRRIKIESRACKFCDSIEKRRTKDYLKKVKDKNTFIECLKRNVTTSTGNKYYVND